jgi:lipid II:glycine glycyltransferase (peptidoglycan interpeptide bridge formation enzyme)
MNTEFVRSLTTQQQQQWSDFLKQSDHAHPNQHYSMSQIEIAKGRTSIFAIGSVNNQIVVAGLFSIRPLWFGRKYSLEAICLSGPVFNDPAHLKPFLGQTIDYFGQIGVGRISMTPFWFYPEAEAVKDVFRQMRFKSKREPIPTGLVDLRRSEEEMIAALSQKTRKDMRQLEKLPINVYPITQLEDTQPLYHCLSKMRSEKRILPMSWNEFKGLYLWAQDNPQMGCFLRADYEQTFISGMLLKYGTKCAHGSAYAINTEAKKMPPKTSLGFNLWWQSLLWVKKQGSCNFDVDYYEENVEPTHPFYGFYKFKKHFKPVQVYRIEPVCYDYQSTLCVLLKSSLILEKINGRIKSIACRMKNQLRKNDGP